MKKYFVSGIGTDVGKTIASAILTEYLEADYWKPIQCGNLEDSDSIVVKSLISNPVSFIYKEAYRFNMAASPHTAAKAENVKIDLKKLIIPVYKNDAGLIIEGAGGLLVPLNEDKLVIDLIHKFETELILVSKHYLGSINHSLLSVEALKTRGIKIKGIIFNGMPNPGTEEAILGFSGCQMLFRMPDFKSVDKFAIREFVKSLPLNIV